MRFIENPRHWRVSQSGYSIKTGWSTEAKIVAGYHCPFESPFNSKRFNEWLDNAQRICDLHNAAVDAEEAAAKDARIAGLEEQQDAVPEVVAGIVSTLENLVDKERAHAAALESQLAAAQAELAAVREDAERLRGLINTPQTADWFDAVRLEAAHQQERWGSQHDAGKTPADWFWLIGYLAGKALQAFLAGDTKKGLHHIISTSAALLNWHRHMTGEMKEMRPGIEPPKDTAIDAERAARKETE